MSYHRMVLRICLGFCALLLGAGCVKVQASDPIPTEGAQSGIIVILGDDPYLEAFSVGEEIRIPATVSDATQILELTYACTLDDLGLKSGELRTESETTEPTQPLPYPTSAFEWLQSGKWAPREPPEALQAIGPLKIESTFNPCPEWEISLMEKIGPRGSSDQGFLFSDRENSALVGVSGAGVFRVDSSTVSRMSPSTEYFALAKGVGDSVVAISFDGCLHNFPDDGEALPCIGRNIDPSETLVDLRTSPSGNVYFASNFPQLIRLTSSESMSIALPSFMFGSLSTCSVTLGALGLDDFVSFAACPNAQQQGGFFRIGDSRVVEPIIKLPGDEGDEELITFGPESNGTLLIGTESSATTGRVYRFDGQSFDRELETAGAVQGVLAKGSDLLIAVEASGALSARFAGRECPMPSVATKPRRALYLEDHTIVVLSKTDMGDAFVTVLVQTHAAPTCGFLQGSSIQ